MYMEVHIYNSNLRAKCNHKHLPKGGKIFAGKINSVLNLFKLKCLWAFLAVVEAYAGFEISFAPYFIKAQWI